MWVLWALYFMQVVSVNCKKTVDMSKFVSVQDFYESARSRLEGTIAWNYLEDGSDDQFTFHQNRRIFKRWVIRPRVLRDISNRSLTTWILGKPVAFPVAVAPSGMHKVFHPLGELATAKGAEAVGTIYILSTMSSCSMEDVALAAPHGRKWFQLYILKDRQIVENLLFRAEKAGFEAVVLTLGIKVVGNRWRFEKSPLVAPELGNFDNGTLGVPGFSKYMDQSFNWEDLSWIRERTDMKIILKGILTPEDARLAIKYGADAIVVSNLGGRQLDSTIPTLEALPGIVDVVQERLEVYVDGGFLLGTDVFKALALGAKLVLVGRAPLYGLTVAGEMGVRKVLNIYKHELDTAMALSGESGIAGIDRKYLQRYNPV